MDVILVSGGVGMTAAPCCGPLSFACACRASSRKAVFLHCDVREMPKYVGSPGRRGRWRFEVPSRSDGGR